MATGVYLLYPETPKQLRLGLIGSWRFLSMAAVGAVVAADYKWTLRNVTKDDEEYDTLLSAVHKRSALRLRRLFELHKGVFVKAGQHVAALGYVLPEEYVDTMRVLHDRAPTMPYEDVCRVIAEDFGNRDPREIFEEFNPQPLAAASLAQVHEARGRDGRRYAVKVQFPGLRELCASDIASIGVILDAVCWLFPEFKLRWLVEEFQRNLPAELDFENEARNAERVRDNFHRSKHPAAKHFMTPEINWSLTSNRIITMEYIDGAKANDVQALQARGLDVVAVATLLADLFSIMIFEHGFVHCDPHPGNILVRPTAKDDPRPVVCLLDHGLYKELPDEFRLDYCRLWNALLHQDLKQVEAVSKKLGVTNFYLFACMLTSRTWETVSAGGLGSDLAPAEKDKLKQQAAVYAAEITQILDVVPQQLLLLLKTNDNLRSINSDLGSPINTHSISLHHVVRVLYDHEQAHSKSFSDSCHAVSNAISSKLRLFFLETIMAIVKIFTTST